MQVIARIGLIQIVLVFALYSCPALAAEILVPAQESKIQAGLDAAASGDIVRVADGTYFENIVWPDVDGITLISSGGPSNCTIDGGGAGSVITVVTTTRDALTKMTVLDGFTITNGVGIDFQYDEELSLSASCGGGVLVHNCSPTIRNLQIWDNTAVLGGGMFLGFSSATIKNNVIAGWGDGPDPLEPGNRADKGGGIYLHYSSPAIVNNTIAYNEASTSGGGGIYADKSGASVVNSIIWGNGDSEVEIGAKESGLSITYSCIQRGWSGEGVVMEPPGFENPDGGEWILGEGSKCIDAGDPYSRLDVEDHLNPEQAAYPAQGTVATDMGAYGGTGALPEGVLGGEMIGTLFPVKGYYIVAEDIIVPEGGQLKIEPGVELRFHNRSGLMVYGELIAEGIEAEEYGITFTRWEEWDTGAGIRFHYRSTGDLSYCLIEYMENGYGGGISCMLSSPSITSCTISNNIAADVGGGIFCLYSKAKIKNCTISENMADGGGGIDCLNASPTITNCTISGNEAFGTWGEGGGLHIQGDSSPAVTNCMIFNNRAGEEGGGISCKKSSPTIDHCTISGNSSDQYGGGVYCHESSSTITNCILWADSAPDSQEIYVDSDLQPVVMYSDVQGGWPGEGNIDADPLFVDPLEDDFHLGGESPCIDAGIDSDLRIDIEGDMRPAGAGFDMGADEYCVSDIDLDGDGYTTCADCDDGDPDINTGAEEICDNGIDDDCDGEIDTSDLDCCTDFDGDGYAVEGERCGPIDCDDSDRTVCPDPEFCPEICDEKDNDCDGDIDEGFEDGDGDGLDWCKDCNDSDPAIYPGATDPCDGEGIDQDCDGADGVPEICGNEIDDDCDDLIDGEDLDCQKWEKYVGNPVLDLGPPGAWDNVFVASPSILFDGTEHKMWYAGSDNGSSFRIGYATSDDGIEWSKYAGNPVLDLGSSGEWDEDIVGLPEVLFDGGEYRMWYIGSDDGGDTSRIGYATSDDGIEWSKYAGNPVLDVGPEGSWDEVDVRGPCVLSDGKGYRMWFTGSDAEDNSRIGYATSDDGIEWIKHAGNPVLDLGASGSWDANWVFGPEVIYLDSEYKMWFAGRVGPFDGIGYATSDDGIEWTKHAGNPVLDHGSVGIWDFLRVSTPRVLIDEDCKAYKMWYTGLDAGPGGSNFRIGYAISLPDGLDLDGDGSYDVAGEPCGGWDCDDSDPQIHPGVFEICDGKDNNCDGETDEGFEDADGDGSAYCMDCDDADPTIHPGAAELCDERDNDCDGEVPDDETDADEDGWMICEGDCDDSDDKTYHGAAVLCDGKDNDCDGWISSNEIDDDGDGYVECGPWVGHSGLKGGDCLDTDPATYPGAYEKSDSRDNDCDGTTDDEPAPIDDEEEEVGGGDGHCGCAQYRAPAQSGPTASAVVYLAPVGFICFLRSRVRRKRKRA